MEHENVSALAHIGRFGGLTVFIIGVLINLSGGDTNIGQAGLLLMAGGVSLEVLVHYLEGELLV